MSKITTKVFQSRILFAVIFFGLAGVMWGGALYAGQHSRYPLTAIGGLSLAVLGGLGLGLHAGGIRRVFSVLGLGFGGIIIGFGLAGVNIYPLLIWGTTLFAVFPSAIIDLLKLEPDLKVAAYWLNFAVAGAFMGLFFSLGLKEKILPMVLRGAIGFGLAAIIGPILGNIIGNLFNSLFVSYTATFLIIGAVFGFSISLKLSKKGKEGPTAQ